MSFKLMEIKDEYRSLCDRIARDFFIPVMKEAVLYQRAVGFFSSTALIEISKGISSLVRNNGTIQLIASPHLSDEDIIAIEKGYEQRDHIIERALLRELVEGSDPLQCDRLNLLAYLISSGKMDIRIAVTRGERSIGIFHEKMGLFTDQDGNRIAFSGSMNESLTALSYNYESIDVFRDWENPKERSRVDSKARAFDALWSNVEPGVEVRDFPKAKEEIIRRFAIGEPDLMVDEHEFPSVHLSTGGPRVPQYVNIRPYQKDAIMAWEAAGFRGIFDMATGTGKTYTALAAIAHLYKYLNAKLAVIIVCPFQHLVEQWVEDIVNFGMKPIISYSASTQRDWRNRLRQAILSFTRGVSQHFCMVTTNATYSSDYVQEQIAKLRGNVLLVVDEAHNFGAENLRKLLNENIPYRLALSATIERNGDPEGTQCLFEYFGDRCITYTLKMAIDSHMLTPYYYHPILVTLNEEELSEYKDLTKKVISGIKKTKTGQISFTEYAKTLLLMRARLVAAAHDKIAQLKNQIKPYVNDKHMLVYCGATTMHDTGYAEGTSDEGESRQVDIVADMLGNELDMRVAKFTAENSAQERELLKERFFEGKHLQALIAIRCLDEGVNIPSIKTAFILASSTNPKEYVQRRGRVLRNFPGKTHADIYDFITLPFSPEDAMEYSEQDVSLVRGLAKRELVRMKDFASIAENPFDADELISLIQSAFQINEGEEDLDVRA